MKPLREFRIAMQAYGKGFSLLWHKKVRVFLLIPIVLNALLIFGGYTLLGNLANHLSESLFALTGAQNWTFLGSEYFDELLAGLLHFTFKALFFLFMILYGGFLVIMLMSPLFSLLSERVEAMETKVVYPFTLKKFVQDIWRGLRIALRNGALQLLLSVGIFMMGFLPILGILAPFLLFATSSFFYGFSFMDFAMERRYPTLQESIGFMSRHRVAAFGNGAVFAVSLLLPFCNLFLAAFVALWAVIAATLTLLKIEEKESKRLANTTPNAVS